MDIELLAKRFYEHSRHIRGYAPDTIKRYKAIINSFRRFAHLEKIEDITEKNIRELFLNGRTQRNWRPNTYIGYHKTLGVFFRWCIQNGFMTSNPIDDLEVPKLERRLPVNLKRLDALRLLEVVYNYPYQYKFLRYRNHAIFCMFLFAGLRKRELINLKLSEVDVDNLTIFVNQGKGSKDRIIPMSFTLAESLKKYLEERKRLKKTCPEFFVSLNRNMGVTDSCIKRLVELMIHASNIKFSAHKLRHTFATLMLEGGCDIYSLARMMGHSDIKTTTIYLSASAEHLRSQVGKHPLNDLI